MDLFPAGAHYTAYFFVNLAASLLGLFILVFFYRYHRHLFVKPSVMILTCYHILAQWPIVLLSPFAETFLPAPWIFAGLVHGFVLLGLMISYCSFDQSARSIWDSLRVTSAWTAFLPRWQLATLFCAILILASIYLAFVPLEETGLYALFIDPEHAVSARESSLKLLDNWIPKYALTLLGNAIAPLLTVVAINFVLLNRKCAIWEKSLWVALLAVCWMLSALSGAKAMWSYLIVVSLAVIAWRLRLRIPAAWVVAGLAAILAPAFVVFMVFSLTGEASDCSTNPNEQSVKGDSATDSLRKNLCAVHIDISKMNSAMLERNPAISIMAALGLILNRGIIGQSEGALTSIMLQGALVPHKKGSASENTCNVERSIGNKPGLALDTISQIIATNKRAFVLPAVVSIWFADYAQRNGPIGLAGIPRLASAAGIAPIDLPNRIGLIYAPCYYGHKVMESVSATTGFLFAQYGYFGLLALPLALAGLIVCDGLLLIIRTFPDAWIAPTLAFISLTALKFTQSDYLTIWFTHGLGINIFLIMLLAKWPILAPADSAASPR
jgi:hypothetical protein